VRSLEDVFNALTDAATPRAPSPECFVFREDVPAFDFEIFRDIAEGLRI
jgi:hypothetical protein